MNLFEKTLIGSHIFKALFLKKKSPLIFVLHITYRCNLRCRYCGYWERKEKEMDTRHVCSLIDQFYHLGTKFIVLTGGEPLLREDLAEIIGFCKERGMLVSVNSNGTLVRERIHSILNADAVKLSLDGPRDINDYVKGRGVYDKVIDAIKVCLEKRIKVSITTVLSRYNIKYISCLLDIAKELNVSVSFQPAAQSHCGNKDKDISLELPDETEFKRAVSYLIREKDGGNKQISNSKLGLKHLYCWPRVERIPCLFSLLSCFMSPDGRVFICDMFPDAQSYLVSRGADIRDTFNKLVFPHACDKCWVATVVDFNLLSKLNLHHLIEVGRNLN